MKTHSILFALILAFSLSPISGCKKVCSDCPAGQHLALNKPDENKCYCCPDNHFYCSETGQCCPDGYAWTDGSDCYDYAGYLNTVGVVPCN